MSRACHYCESRSQSRDHVVPRSWGGRRTVRACHPCNAAKDDKPPTCRCPECRAAVADWLDRVVPSVSAWLRPKVSALLDHYATAPERTLSWRWWVSSDGDVTLHMTTTTRSLVWVPSREPTPTVIDRSVVASVWEAAGQERRPRGDYDTMTAS